MAHRDVPQTPLSRKKKTEAREVNKVAEQMNIVRKLVRKVIEASTQRPDDGSHLMQLISSDPGMGKTYIVMDELKKCGIRAAKAGPTGIDAFVKFLWDHKKDPIIVFDDCDKLLRSETIANVAKKAWDRGRLVVHTSVEARKNVRRPDEDEDDFKARHDPAIPAPVFKIRPRLIWLTNVNPLDTKSVSEKMDPHFAALASRGLGPFRVNTDMDNGEELFRYVLELATTGNMLNNMPGMNLVKTERVLEWYVRHRNFLREVSPRSIKLVAEHFRSMDAKEAEELLQYSQLVPDQQRNLSDYIPPVYTRGVYETVNDGKKEKKVCIRAGYWTAAIQLEKEKRISAAAVQKGLKRKPKK